MQQERFLEFCKEGKENQILSGLEDGLDPNFEHKNKTPLNNSIIANNLRLVKILIDAGADVNFPLSNKESAILTSAWSGNVEILKILISNGANPYDMDSANSSVVCRASEYANKEFLKTLILAGGKSFDFCGCEEGWSPLMHAAYKGKTDIVEMLLSNDVNVNATNLKGQTALMLASAYGKTKIVELLLQSGADLNIGVNEQHHNYGQGHTACPLNMAASKGYLEVVQLLLMHDAPIDVSGEKDGKTALHLSAKEMHYEVVKKLVAAGADIHLKDNYGSTIFSLAKENGVLDQLEREIRKTQSDISNKQLELNSFNIPTIVNSIVSALQNMQIGKTYKSFEVDEGICYMIDNMDNKVLLIELNEKDGYDVDVYHENFSEYKTSMMAIFEELKSCEEFKNVKLNNLEFILSDHT